MRRTEIIPLSHGVPRVDDRRVISGIIFVIRNGALPRAPKEHGPHKTIYNRFIRWSRLGVFSRIFAALAAKGGKGVTRVTSRPLFRRLAFRLLHRLMLHQLAA